jgi:kynurenine formamidase
MKSFCNMENFRVIDLSVPITEHWRYPIEIKNVKAFADGNCLNIREFNMRTHWYTHIDAPLHYVDGGKSLDDFNLLDMLVGKASVLNLSDIQANEPITRAMLEKAKAGVPMNDILFIRTDW